MEAQINELVGWVAKDLLLAVKQMSKYKAPTFTAYKKRAKQILSHPDLALIDRGHKVISTVAKPKVIPLAEALKEMEKQ